MPAPLTPLEVFSSSEQLFDRLVVVTNEAIFTANPDKPLVAGIAAVVMAAGPMVKSVVPDADEIAFTSISSVKTNRHRTDLNVYYHDGSRDRMKNIDFDSAAIRDRAFDTLRRRLGPRFVKDEQQYGLAGAAFAPLATTLVLAGVTWFLMGAARELDAGVEVTIRGSQRGLKRMVALALDLLGPTGVMIVGGLLVVASIAWLVARLKNPPLMATLTAKK
jgi:hypothetical protein